jgi:serine protease Do
MRKLFLVLWVGMSASLSFVHGAIALSNDEVNDIAKALTVRIKGASSSGSGVLIRKEGNTYTILTAAHVLASQDSYEVYGVDGQRYILKASSIKRHPEADIAIAQFSSSNTYKTAVIGDPSTLREGASIFVAGFPAQTAALTESIYSFTTGTLTAQAKRPFKDGYGLVYTNTTLPGMSGGPVLNSSGALVGIHGRADAQAQLQDEQINPKIYIKSGVNLGIPVTALFTLVPRNSLRSPHQPLPQPDPLARRPLARRPSTDPSWIIYWRSLILENARGTLPERSPLWIRPFVLTPIILTYTTSGAISIC